MRLPVALALAFISATISSGADGPAPQAAKRLVIIKVDGLPAGFVDRYIDRTDPATGRYLLPWFHEIFEQRGTRIANFYVRGISLSAPSWSMLDSGQHLAIRGNAEFDRYYPRIYDYLNFFPFYLGFARDRRADMPGVEVLDESGIPLLIDQFPYNARYESNQLYQRGVRWATLRASLKSRVARPVRGLIDEWQNGFDFGSAILQTQERELISKLADPNVLYLDYFDGYFDHVAHLSNDESAQLNELRRIDATVGRIWTAIGASPLANETVLALVSDHGINSNPGKYSEGYDLVTFFSSVEGGALNVITDRHPRDEYKLRGLDPFVSWVATPTDSGYLAGQKDYPTALLDLDGNERASVQLRNSDLNELQILFQQLRKPDLEKAVHNAVADEAMRVIDSNRAEWSRTADEMKQELAALDRAVKKLHETVAAEKPERWTANDRSAGRKLQAAQLRADLSRMVRNERGYTAYVDSLQRLLSLTPKDLLSFRGDIEQYIPKGVMGQPNSIRDIQRYVAGAAPAPVLNPNGAIDENRSFIHVNYFARLTGIRVRNSIEPAWGSAPVDFVAMRVPPEALRASLQPADMPDCDAVFLYQDPANQALILSQIRNGELWLRYVPVSGAGEDEAGNLRFNVLPYGPGLPLKIVEDPDLAVTGDRAAWLGQWHSEREWFNAIHRTRYSNAVIGLHEFFRKWEPQSVPAEFRNAPEEDWPLLKRFCARLRSSTEPDLLIVAKYGWNFNVRSFNPGGNHGSFFRISTHSVFMLAGAGVPAGLQVEEPYDSLNFVPTLMSLLGRPVSQYPAPPIPELVPARQ